MAASHSVRPPTAKRYISLYIHRGHRPQRSKWCIEPQGEFDTCSSADQGRTGIALVGTTGAFWVTTLKQSDKTGNESANFPAIQTSKSHGMVIRYQSWITETARHQTT
jgi:hypothetical protein